MSSPELRESSTRMLKVTGDRWPKNVPIPRATGEDIFTSCMARDLKIFPYGRNVAAVVSAVMEKDRQDAAQKRRAVVRIGDPFREAKRVRGGGVGVKSAAPGSSKPAPTAKQAALGPKKSLMGAKAASSGASKPPSGEPVKGRRVPPQRVLMRWGCMLPTSTRTSMCWIILLVSFFRSLTNIMVQARMRGNCLLS
jgi:hypothetical protein